MSHRNEKAWYALYTRPRSEKKLSSFLTSRGVDHFLPIIRLRKKWSDRIKWTEKAVFDSYIFVNINFIQDAKSILRSPHAVRFVEFGGEPAEINHKDMELMQISIKHFAENAIVRDAADFLPGQVIKISVGPFAGKEALIRQIQGKTHVIVNFPALNKTLEVEIPVSHLESPVDKLLSQ